MCLGALAGGERLSNQWTNQPTPSNQQPTKCHDLMQFALTGTGSQKLPFGPPKKRRFVCANGTALSREGRLSSVLSVMMSPILNLKLGNNEVLQPNT
jgi:hypothetical protein